MINDTTTFETHRPAMLALAYRMLGDMAHAEDVVQEAWVRWQNRQVDVEAPKAFLLKTITRLCLDGLGSASARHEESRSDRLPEPVDLDETAMGWQPSLSPSRTIRSGTCSCSSIQSGSGTSDRRIERRPRGPIDLSDPGSRWEGLRRLLSMGITLSMELKSW